MRPFIRPVTHIQTHNRIRQGDGLRNIKTQVTNAKETEREVHKIPSMPGANLVLAETWSEASCFWIPPKTQCPITGVVKPNGQHWHPLNSLRWCWLVTTLTFTKSHNSPSFFVRRLKLQQFLRSWCFINTLLQALNCCIQFVLPKHGTPVSDLQPTYHINSWMWPRMTSSSLISLGTNLSFSNDSPPSHL